MIKMNKLNLLKHRLYEDRITLIKELKGTEYESHLRLSLIFFDYILNLIDDLNEFNNVYS